MAKQPHLLVEAGDVHDTAIVPGDPGRVDRIANQCDEHTVVAENREYRVVNAREPTSRCVRPASAVRRPLSPSRSSRTSASRRSSGVARVERSRRT